MSLEEKKSPNGWNEWSRYVLKELERLNNNVELNKISSETKDNEILDILKKLELSFATFKVKIEMKTGLIGIIAGMIIPGLYILIKAII